ncbi:MAG: N-acyl homoserine lactonase family protein [Candidatus Bathyarchaeia archaeon]
MPLEIHVLHVGDLDLDQSFLVLGYRPGTIARVPIYSYLILGGEKKVLVDAGWSHPKIMSRLGMKGMQKPEQDIRRQLKTHGLNPTDVDYLVHTHLHIDHAGMDRLFTKAQIVMQRRELEYSVSGLMGEQYPAEYITYLVEQLHKPGRLLLLDGDIGGDTQLIKNVWCVAAKAHTPGSTNVYVKTNKGMAVLCGDVIYDIEEQTRKRKYWPTGNHAMTKREEMAAIAKIVHDADFILPIHDYEVQEKYGNTIPP